MPHEQWSFLLSRKLKATTGSLVVCGALVSAFGQTSAPGTGSPQSVQNPLPASTEQHVLAQQFLDEKIALWRERLKLRNWQISAQMVHRSDLPAKTLGGISWDKSKKSAVIWVLDPSEYRLPFHEILADLELTIVHELVHLDLASLPRGQASRTSEEQAVDGIAKAMLELDRRRE